MRRPYHTSSLKDQGTSRNMKQKELKAQRQQGTIGKQGLVDTLGYTHELTAAVSTRPVGDQESQLKYQPGRKGGVHAVHSSIDTIGKWNCWKKESKFSSWMQPLRGYPGACRWPYIDAKQATPRELIGFNMILGKTDSERDRGRIRKGGNGNAFDQNTFLHTHEIINNYKQ